MGVRDRTRKGSWGDEEERSPSAPRRDRLDYSLLLLPSSRFLGPRDATGARRRVATARSSLGRGRWFAGSLRRGLRASPRSRTFAWASTVDVIDAEREGTRRGGGDGSSDEKVRARKAGVSTERRRRARRGRAMSERPNASAAFGLKLAPRPGRAPRDAWTPRARREPRARRAKWGRKHVNFREARQVSGKMHPRGRFVYPLQMRKKGKTFRACSIRFRPPGSSARFIGDFPFSSV